MSSREMKKMGRDAAVAPSTVTSISKGQIEPIKRKRGQITRRATPVLKVQVDPRVWKAAKQLASGDATRIKVISDTEVVVTNNSRKKGK